MGGAATTTARRLGRRWMKLLRKIGYVRMVVVDNCMREDEDEGESERERGTAELMMMIDEMDIVVVI